MSADPVLRVLMVDDDPNDVLLAERALRRSGYSVVAHRIDTAEGLSAALTEQAWDLIISDYRMPTFSGLEALAIVRRSLDVPFILMSGVVGEETAVAALQAGADDYILKDNLGRLIPSVRRALRETAERRRRRQAEDALRASESRYRSLVETSPDAIVLLDLHGTIQMANRQAAALFHHESPETLLGRNAIGLLVPTDHERAAAALQATAAGAATSPHVYTAMTRDGATFTLELQASRVLAADAATVENIMIVARNITERTRAVERLRFQADLLETVGQAIIATDVTGVITYWNRAAEALYGWSAAEVVGLNILSILPTEPFRPHDAETLASVVRGGPSTGEYLARHRNGRAIPILTSAVPVHDEEGAVIGVIGVSTDISTRVHAEDAVRQSEARARAQFQGLPVPTYTWQRNGDNWILVDYNRAAERITSGTIHGLLGREVRTLYERFPEILDNFTRCWREETTIEQTIPYHFQLSDMDRHLVISYVFVPPDMVLVHTIDVTERERAQAAAARHVEQLSALRAIDTAIINSLDLRHTLDILLAQIAAQLQVDAAQILLLNTHTQMLEYRAGRGFWGAGINRVSLRLGQGLAGRVGLERRMIRTPVPASEDHPRSTPLTEEQFVGYVGAPLIAKGQLQGVLEVFHRTPLAPEAAWLDFLATLAGQVAIAIDNATLFTDLQQSNTELVLAYDTTIEGWSRALDLRDKETEGHSKRVTSMTLSLAQAMGLTDAELVHVRRGALLHDIGKMGVPDAILHKPGPLTNEEWIVMRKHPVYAYDLLSPIDYLRPALAIPYCHHEKWDGTGYPRGLIGEQIPFAARLFAVVDVADALLSDRPYRAGWPAERVRRHIASLSGSHFDPAVVDAFMQLEETAALAAGFSLIA